MGAIFDALVCSRRGTAEVVVGRVDEEACCEAEVVIEETSRRDSGGGGGGISAINFKVIQKVTKGGARHRHRQEQVV